MLSKSERLSVGVLVSLLALAGAGSLSGGIRAESLLGSAAVLGAGLLLHHGLERRPEARIARLTLGETLQDLLGNLAVLGSGLVLAFRLGMG
jgi:hypothetical protein